MSILSKLSFKDQAFRLREDAILDATTRILAVKGFDLMTIDDIAAEVGISKPSLYKHFKSKEELVGAVMTRLIDEAGAQLASLDAGLSALQQLQALLEWALRVRLGGGLPFLPSTSAHVREMLMKNLLYVGKVIKLNSQLEKRVRQAKAAGELRADLPDDVILFSYYARSCDPTVEYLRLYSKMGDEDIVRYMLDVSFQGMLATK
ncbi:TetR/AcrR family transcriptional regulator [Chitinilyticum litopenaei]|uniref:TetR/AcrR family transcriptional regulator n=1 Tax=Chitinilyticum litopenaei TaxID=1121276 RepID=UPI00041BA233|nr:TetR/AcrR family transcriptional regulator [Chitinilyticum litopenaei]